jgi:hypothetical protein
VKTTTDTHATTAELLEAVYSVLSVPRLYNEGQLPLQGSLETAGDRPLVNTQQTEKTYVVRAVVNCRVCGLAIAL